jgi:hypothetical protein
MRGIERRVGIVAYAMVPWIQAGQKAAVCGQRQRRDGRGALKQDPFTREPVDRRHRGALESVRR